MDNDTIVAIATAAGQGGIGVVRISGGNALMIAKILTRQDLQQEKVNFCRIYTPEGEVLDSGIALYFKAPRSFTGEDVVELQAHGSPVVLSELVSSALSSGAREARPGEFSERAFLNNKIDLTQAEAIADLISSASKQAAHSAINSLRGEFSKRVNRLIEKLVSLRAYVEAALDFPEEEIDFLNDRKIIDEIVGLLEQTREIEQQAKQGSLLSEGMTLVLAGKPNAGKSSLLNQLSGRDSAIVTAIAGTTRDVLREHIQIDGMPVHIVDTAGLRNAIDAIEIEGIQRAKNEIENADRVLLVCDSSDTSQTDLTLKSVWPEQLGVVPTNIPVTVVRNKCDLINEKAEMKESSITLSAKSGEGLELLKEHLKQVMGFVDSGSGQFSARRRHLNCLKSTQGHITRGLQQLQQGHSPELLAEELRLAQQDLEEITGRFTADDLLDKIFRDFCIGK